MKARPTPIVELFRELKRRKVIHVAAVYLGGAIVGVDAVNNFGDVYNLPESLQRAFAVLLVLGFPVALMGSWWYEWTGGSIRKVETEPASPAVRRLALVSAVALATTAAAIGTVVATQETDPAEAVTDAAIRSDPMAAIRRSTVLGILPFEHVGRDDSESWLCAALEAHLERSLSEVSAFTVVHRQTLESYLAHTTPLDSMARLLDVDYFILAQVMDAPDGRSRVLVELVDGPTGEVAQSAVIPVRSRAPDVVIDSLVMQIAEFLRHALGREVRLAQWQAGTDDTVALRLRYQANQRYADARELVNADRQAAEREFAAADSLLALATSRDRHWADPHLARAELADSWAMARVPVPDPAGAAAAYRRGIGEAEEALKHDPGSADALALRGHLRWRMTRFVPIESSEKSTAVARAEADLRAALDRDPHNVMAAASLSEILIGVHRRFADARHFALRAYREDAYLERDDEIINRIALASLELGDDDDALAWCRLGLQRDPDYTAHFGALLEIMAWGDVDPDPEEAWGLLDSVRRVSPPAGAYYGYAVAAVLARAGLPDSARAVLARHTDPMSPDARDQYLNLEAAVRFRLGDIGEAERLLDRYREVAPAAASGAASRRMLRGFVEVADSG